MELLSQRSRFSTEPSTKGFDNSAGDKWIYPENYPIRDYQFNIVQSALYHNTLVCLPTGLGKTFIAAVVMYNFWRWYPKGKIIFLAPTKPLVAQQINACHEIMGIASEETIELTGATDQKKRQLAWSESNRARVIFATPQVFHKDLEKNIVPTELVKCIVIDEAHRALGRHSYCESIRLLSEQSKYFRILGLSATPGGKLDAVQEVIRNLLITHLELRDDTSPDITPYINERKLDIILVGLGEDLERFKHRYIEIMDPHVRVLVDNNVIRGNTGNLSKGRIFFLNKDWQQKQNRGPNHGQITKTLMILMTMYHAYELLIRHGLRAFYHFYQKHEDKYWLNKEQGLMQLLEEINCFLGPFPDLQPMPDGSTPLIPENIKFGHNKFFKLKELLLRHFESYEGKEEGTKAIVFVEFRDIVNEVYVLLLQSMPLVRPQKFVGQAGQKRKEQKKALEDFRSNKVNVLISTSVGEEGLDVGEVDLIVCFDITNVSPIRLVQRMGRTGRKRDGHIVVLVTDGKEHQTLRSSMSRRDSLNSKVLHSSGILSALYKEGPRMVPDGFEPECRKTMVTVQSKVAAPSKRRENAKEPKKPRKRADNINKNKNSKNPVPSGSQLLLKFLKKPQEITEMEVDNDIVGLSVAEIRPTTSRFSQQSQSGNNTVKSQNVKLLTCDDAAVEFLTLCTMKKSQNERKNVDDERTKPYFPAYYEKPKEIDLNFQIPDVEILNCLASLKPCVEEITNNECPEDSVIHEEDAGLWRADSFEDGYVNHDLPRDDDDLVIDSKFEALLDDSSDETEMKDYPTEGKVDWSENVEDKVDWVENIDDLDFDEFGDEWSEGKETNHERNRPLDENKSDEDTRDDIANNQVKENGGIKFGIFENLLNEDSETSCENYDSDTALERYTKTEDPANLLSEEFITISDDGEPKGKNSIETGDTKLCETFKLSKGITIISSDDSETQSDVVFVWKTENNECPSLNSRGKKDGDVEKLIGNQFSSTSEPPREKITSVNPNKRVNEESIDLLADYESESFKKTNSEQRHFKIFSKIQGNHKNSSPINTPKNLERDSADNTSELENVASTSRIVATELVNNEGRSHLSLNSIALGFDDSGQRYDAKIRSGERFSQWKDPIEEKTESDDDIFRIDDLSVDSEFEEEINKLEKIAAQDPSTRESRETIVNRPQIVDRDNSVVSELGGKIPVEEFKKNPSDDSRESAGRNPKSDDKPPDEKENNKRSNEFVGIENSLKTKESDLNLDDCDWGSSDFETFVSSKVSTTRGNAIESSESRKRNSDQEQSNKIKLKNLKELDKSSEWLTTRNPKPRLSLCEKLSRNFCKDLSAKQENKKPSPRKDSDSENEFFVSRLETTLSKDIVSDYFTKPHPVSGSKIFGGSGTMNNRSRSIRTPLSLRQKNVNGTKDLEKFAAPVKYNKRGTRDTKNDERKVGAGRPKSASCDFDTRKRKKPAKTGKRARVRSDFIDDEASVSSDCDGTSGSSGNDDDLDNFVSYTQYQDDHVDMQAHYLQTLRSPRRPGGFHMRRPKSPNAGLQIYSQPGPDEPDDYNYDSFCVNENEDVFEESSSSDEFSRLEELEMRHKSRKRKRTKSKDSRAKTKRKVLLPRSDATSSEDETEKLRQQIQEESFTLKNQSK